jgi:hypothetical protein
MMTTRESGTRKPRPMQCLLLVPEQHRQEVLRQFLAENVARHASKWTRRRVSLSFSKGSRRGTTTWFWSRSILPIRIHWGSWRMFSD